MTQYYLICYIVQMKILITNTLILPMTKRDYSLFGSIAIEDGKIIGVGDITRSFNPEVTIDGSHLLAIPGLINAHTHASMQYFKNFNDNAPTLEEWLKIIWSYEHLLNEEDIYIASTSAIAEMISSGTTCFSDMYFFNQSTMSAVVEQKMKANIGLTLFGDEKDSMKRIDASLTHLKKGRSETKGSVLFDIAPHAIYTCTRGTLEMGRALADREKANLHIHASESLFEVEQSLLNHKLSPIAYLESIGTLNRDTNIAHVVHPRNNDIEIFKATGAHIIHNPSS
ncbi:MAG: hypothetical protein EOM67_06520, partial [Spirochaetia bacterium]|nr:hypothetical protein [Spirochaetia bacterium]